MKQKPPDNATRKRKRQLLLLITLTAVAAFLYSGSRLLKPEKLGMLLENQLSQRLGMKVIINKASLNLAQGLHVALSGFQVGTREEDLFVKAEKIGVDLSFFHLMLGELAIHHIDLDEPEIRLLSLDRFTFAKGGSKSDFSIPLTSIRNGTIQAVYKNKSYALTRIHGSFSHDFANLQTRMFHSPVQIFARMIGQQWTGQIRLSELPMQEIDPDLEGSMRVQVGFQQRKDGARFTADIHSDRIGLPGGGTPVEKLSLKMRCTADRNHVHLSEIHLQTADLSLSGSGQVTGPFSADAYGDANLELAFQSRPFRYDTVVSHLPIEILPDWVSPLFFQQIRGGSISIDNLKYSGKVSDLIDAEQFFRDLFIEAALADLSYGTGYGPERVTGISGTFTIAKGDMLIQSVSGYTDHAMLQCLDLIFPDLMAPDLRIIVNADLDMPAAEFRYLWNAGMEPREIYDLLQPLHHVEGGNIAASVTVQDNLVNNTTQIKGAATLTGCRFAWDEKQIEDLSGTVTAEQLSATIKVAATGKYNQLPIQKFDLLLENVFMTPTYQFSVYTEALPPIPQFKLADGASVIFSGAGKDMAYQGKAILATKGFWLFDDHYYPPVGKIFGSGIFSGSLLPDGPFHLGDIDISTNSGKLKLEYHDENTRGSATLKGIVDLSAKDQDGNVTLQNVRGEMDIGVAWEDNQPVNGHIQLQKLSMLRKNSKTVLNGPIDIAGHILSTTNLSVQTDDFQASVTGSLSLEENVQYFTGEVQTTGFSIGNTSGMESEIRLPESLAANVYITMINPVIYKIPFDKGEARLQIEKQGVNVNDIRFSGSSGKISGSVVHKPDQKTVIDLDLDIRNDGLNKLFQAFEPDEAITGEFMRLNGNLQGATDSLNGNLAFEAINGTTSQSPLLANIFAAMNLYKIIKTQNFDIRKKHFTYNRISSTFTVKDSIIDFNDFLLDSDSLQFSAVGQYRLNEAEIDALIGVQPFETIDKAISVIPIIGWVLTGEGDKLFVICLKAEGSIEDPKIGLATGDTVSKPVADTLLRVLKLPGTIITKPQNLIRETEKK